MITVFFNNSIGANENNIDLNDKKQKINTYSVFFSFNLLNMRNLYHKLYTSIHIIYLNEFCNHVGNIKIRSVSQQRIYSFDIVMKTTSVISVSR